MNPSESADIKVYEPGYLIAKIGASESAGSKGADMPAIGFMAHVDTSSDVSGKNVKACFTEIDGSVINMITALFCTPEEFRSSNHESIPSSHRTDNSFGCRQQGAGVAIAVAVIENSLKTRGSFMTGVYIHYRRRNRQGDEQL